MPKPIENAHATYSSQTEIYKRKGVIPYLLSLAPYPSRPTPWALCLEPFVRAHLCASSGFQPCGDSRRHLSAGCAPLVRYIKL